MANLSVPDFNRLKVFFKALEDIKYNSAKSIPGTVNIKGQRLLVEKNRCFELLRGFGGLKDKTDNEIIDFLAKSGNRGGILGSELTRAQQIEMAQALANKPVAAEIVAQPTGQAVSAEQATPVGTATYTSTGNIPVNIPPTPPIPVFRPIERIPQPDKTPPSYEAAEPIKTEVPTAFQKAFEDEPDYEQALSSGNKLDPTKKPPELQSAAPNTSGQKFNFRGFKMPSAAKTFGSNAQILTRKGLIRGGRGLAGMIKTGLESANPFLGRMANNGLGVAERMTGFGKPGGGSNSIFGKIPRFGRKNPSPAKSPPGTTAKKRWGLRFAIGMLLFMVLVGGLAISGANQPQPSPSISPTTSTNISNCQFTRGAETPSAAKFQSSSLLSYIQEAAQKSTIPPAVLAAFIRVESPSSSNMSDEQIAAYTCIYSGPGKNVSETGALGIMQIQPPGTTSLQGDPASCDDCIDAGARLIGKTLSTMTEADYCNPRTGIIVGSGWILKKMSNIGLGDGTKWDPAWTNNRIAIEALVHTYYGDVLYPDVNTGPYNYADDVSTSIQNCQTSSGTVPPPPADGNYKKWLEDFGVKIYDGFVPEVYQWAYEALASTATVAPKFKERLGSALVEVIPTCDISHTSVRTIFLRNKIQFCPDNDKDGPTGDINYFKQVFVHELGHVINGSYRPGTYGDRIKSAIAAEGYLTAYAQNAATADDEICGYGDANTRADEDFAESISYFVNTDIKERDYGCDTNSNQNPIYLQAGGSLLYPAHYQLMTELLK